MLFLELLICLLLIVVNGIFAMSELALVSSRKSRLEQLADNGYSGARCALELIADPSRFLSTIQIGITLVGVIAGALGGVTFGRRLGEFLDTTFLVAPYGDSVGIGITVVGITYLSLVIGELVPKRIALSRPELIASLMARPMRTVSWLAAPAVRVLQDSTEAVLRVLHLSHGRDTTVTEEEVKSLIAEGTQAGIFAPAEQEMIEGVLRLADRSVRVVMTPRTQIVWVDEGADNDAVVELVMAHRFSRLLVCNGSIDEPVGFIHTKDLLPEALSGNGFTLGELVTPVVCIPENTSVLKLLSKFKREGVHLAVVVDEYGSTEGIVTLTDVIEAIVGDLPEEGEADSPRIVQREDGSWLVDGMVPTDEVKARTGIEMTERPERLSGFMLGCVIKLEQRILKCHFG